MSRLALVSAISLVVVSGCATSGALRRAVHFTDLAAHMSVGDAVIVTTPTGTVAGKTVSISKSDVVIRSATSSQAISCEEVAKIERRPGSVAIGAAVGIALAAAPAWNACNNKGANPGCVAGSLALSGVLGALVDGAHHRPKIVYQSSPGSCAAK